MWEFLIILHIVSLSVGICLSLYIMSRSARRRTSQYIFYMGGTVVSIWPQAEIKINKRKDTKTSEYVWH
jgi:hypothetical protein